MCRCTCVHRLLGPAEPDKHKRARAHRTVQYSTVHAASWAGGPERDSVSLSAAEDHHWADLVLLVV